MEPDFDVTQPLAGPPSDFHTPPSSPASTTLAPIWHTVVLVLVIATVSIAGSMHAAQQQPMHNRYATYAATGVMELLMLAWVAWGMRLRRIPIRTLFGDLPSGMRGLFADLGVAIIFWLVSLMALGTVGATWTSVQAWVTHSTAPWHVGSAPIAPARNQAEQTMLQVAPSNLHEAAAWALLCLLVGFVEESVFRGYFQGQFTAWARGNVFLGVLFSAVLFGAAHGYQGLRNIVLLVVFGALFSLLMLYRRSLRPCILAHSLHDLVAGLALGILKVHHIL
jgi:membrane protease YdiL (CAAX protease family)